MVIASLTSWADNRQEIIINGQPVEKTLVQITFSGDDIILRFDDSSTQTADMGDVIIRLYDDDTTAIDQLQTFRLRQPVDGRLEMVGLAAGTTIFIYDTTGKILMRTTASQPTTSIDISSFKRGIYLIKTGKQIIKFIKR